SAEPAANEELAVAPEPAPMPSAPAVAAATVAAPAAAASAAAKAARPNAEVPRTAATDRIANALASVPRITVVGAGRHVGATSTAIALARALSQHSRVVLIDLALQSPNLAAISTEPSAPGMAELVRGAASFRHIITRDRGSRVHLVAAGHVPADASTVI